MLRRSDKTAAIPIAIPHQRAGSSTIFRLVAG